MRSNRGLALMMFAYFIAAWCLLLITTLVTRSVTELSVTSRFVAAQQAFFLAEAGLDQRIQQANWTSATPNLPSGDPDCQPPNDPFVNQNCSGQALGPGEYVVEVTENPPSGSGWYTVKARGYIPNKPTPLATAAVTAQKDIFTTIRVEPKFLGAFGFEWIKMRQDSHIWGDIGSNSNATGTAENCSTSGAPGYAAILCSGVSGAWVHEISATAGGGNVWFPCDPSQPACQARLKVKLPGGHEGQQKELAQPLPQTDPTIPSGLLSTPMATCTVGQPTPPPLCGSGCGYPGYTPIPCVANAITDWGLDPNGNLHINTQVPTDTVQLPADTTNYRFRAIRVEGTGVSLRFGDPNPTGANEQTHVLAGQLGVFDGGSVLARGSLKVYLSGPAGAAGSWNFQTFELGGVNMCVIANSASAWTCASPQLDALTVYVHNGEDFDGPGPDQSFDALKVEIRGAANVGFYGSLDARRSDVLIGNAATIETVDGSLLARTLDIKGDAQITFKEASDVESSTFSSTIESWVMGD